MSTHEGLYERVYQEIQQKLPKQEQGKIIEFTKKHMIRWGVCIGPKPDDEWDPKERFLVDHTTREFLTTVARASFYVGSSYEDRSAYDLEPKVSDLLEFLRRSGVGNVTAIESNDIGLANELFGADVAYLELYDPFWNFYIVVGIRDKLLKLAEMHLFRRKKLYELFEDEVF
ncbi:MAG: hypothetical protein ACXQTW_00685, partial [Candidatus Methanospirareceae archaeon]